MSNYLSQPIEVQPVQSSLNIPLMEKALAMRQGKYDANKSKAEQTLAQYGEVLKALRPEDNEYLAAKLNDLSSAIKDAGDLSLSSNSDNIMSRINAVYKDPIIRAGAMERAKKESLDRDYAERVKKGDGSANQGNYNFALYKAGYQDYMDFKTKSIGSLSYTPYKDLEKEASDFITTMIAKSGDDKIEYKDGDGGIQTVTRKNLNTNQIKQIAYSMLGGNAQNQLEINAWVNTGGYQNKNEILKSTTEVLDQQVKKNADRILKLETENKIDGTPISVKERNKQELAQLGEETSIIATNKEKLTSNISLAATFLEKERFAGTMVNKFGGLYEEFVSGYGVDESFYKKQDVLLARAKYQLDLDEFKYKQSKDGAYGGQLLVGDIITPTESSINQEQEIDNTVKVLSDSLNSTSLAYKNQLENFVSTGSKDQKDQATVILNKYRENLKSGKNEQDAFQAAVIQESDNNSNIIYGEDSDGNKINYLDKIRDLSNKKNTYILGRSKAIEQGTIEHIDNTINSEEGLKAFYNNPDTKMLWHSASGKEGAYSVRDVLIASKIINNKGEKIGDIKKSPNLLKALQQSYYADSALSKNLNPSDITELARTFNENPSDVVTTYTTASTGAGSTIGAAGTPMTYSKINYNTKTGQYLLKAQKNGIKDTFGWNDNSLSGDDATIGKFLNADYKKSQSYINSINKLYGKLPQNQVVAIQSSDKATFGVIKNTANSGLATIPGVLNENTPLNITVDTSGQNVIISQYGVDKDKKVISYKSIVPYKNFIQNAPQNIIKQVDFASNSAHYTVDRVSTDDLKSKNITFPEKNGNAEWMSQTVLKDQPQFVPYLLKQDASNSINIPVNSSFGENSEESKVANLAIEKSNKFNITGDVTKDFNGVYNLTLYMRNTDGDIITSKKVNNISEVDNFKKILDNAPQIYYIDMLKDIFAEQVQVKSTSKNSAYSYKKLMENLQ
jgi:hypothetical protein